MLSPSAIGSLLRSAARPIRCVTGTSFSAGFANVLPLLITADPASLWYQSNQFPAGLRNANTGRKGVLTDHVVRPIRDDRHWVVLHGPLGLKEGSSTPILSHAREHAFLLVAPLRCRILKLVSASPQS